MCSYLKAMYCINPFSDEPIFLIDCQIGKGEDATQPYVDGVAFVRELLAMDEMGKKRIWVWINSPGGLVDEGEAIYSAILKTKTKVNTFCYGMAYSIAGVIFQAGYKRVMLESARLMYHEAYTESGEKSKSLDAINEALTKMISSRSWNNEADVRKMMKKETFITAQEAEASGLCDEIENNKELNAPKANTEKARMQFRTKIFNLNNNQNENKMSKEVAKALGLNEEASADAQASAIKNILNKNEDYDKKMKALTEELDALKKARNEADEEDKKAKAKKDEEDKAAKAKAEADEADKKKNEAKAKILNAAKERNLSLTDEAVNDYVALATSEEALNTVIKTINNTPVVNKAPKIEALNNEKINALGIPLIETAGSDKAGNPIAGDTTKFVNSINSMSYTKIKAALKK